MKVLRISASALALCSLALLAACGGGGGGGGGATPPTPTPAGGGSPPPTATPAPTATPGKTPTPAPTQTPVQTPTPTPTQSPSGGTIQSNGSTEIVQDGLSGSAGSPLVFGKDGWQTNGVTDPEGKTDGDATGGFTSAAQTSINGVSCTLGTEPGPGNYHVHTFVGLYVNGVQYALPDAIGMLSPSGDGPNASFPYPNEGFSQGCSIHTHGTSGVVHIEDNNLSQTFTTQYPQFNLQSLMDIWGQGSFANVASMAANGFAGPMSIYVGTPCPNNTVGCGTPAKNPANNDDIVKAYTLVNSAPSGVVFGHHVAIWIIIGSLPAGGLPAIDFGIAN